MRVTIVLAAMLCGLVWATTRPGTGAPHGAMVTPASVAAAATVTPNATLPEPAGNGFASAEIPRAADGHFYADAQVNGARLRLMVDTGSSSVALTRADAQAAGLQVAAGDFVEAGRGAGGVVHIKRVTLDRIAIGPVAANNVPAVVAEDGLPVSLVGQSFLSRVGRIEIAGDRMVLR